MFIGVHYIHYCKSTQTSNQKDLSSRPYTDMLRACVMDTVSISMYADFYGEAVTLAIVLDRRPSGDCWQSVVEYTARPRPQVIGAMILQ